MAHALRALLSRQPLAPGPTRSAAASFHAPPASARPGCAFCGLGRAPPSHRRGEVVARRAGSAVGASLRGTEPSESPPRQEPPADRPAEPVDVPAIVALLRSRAAAAGRPEPAADGGDVFLCGTGPGDPGLLTLRAVQLMRTCDVVMYDRLVSPEILDLVHAGAVMVYVGKNAGFHTRSQGEIHELMAAFAGAGASVLRLKGGDPFVFGRGGEEAEFLRARGRRVTAIPGITSASGIAADLGVPLTHRGLATSVTFLTGHLQDGGLGEFAARALDPLSTLVVYMGLQTLPELMARLPCAGIPLSTPAAAVERGTTPRQRQVLSPLGDLPRLVAAAGLASPTLLVIGPVVALSPQWPYKGGPAAAAAGRLVPRAVVGHAPRPMGMQDAAAVATWLDGAVVGGQYSPERASVRL